MSVSLAKLFHSEEVPLDTIRDKIIAIDILPWLYKYLFIRGKESYDFSDVRHEVLSSDGVLTSHLVGFLYFLRNLKKSRLSPIICIDGEAPKIKKKEILRRVSQRKRRAEKFELLENNGLLLNESQLISKRNAEIHVGEAQKELIVRCCVHLGIPYYRGPSVQGEKACAMLKLNGLADVCLTTDRDAMLYGTSFYSGIDFKKKSVRRYDFEKNLSSLGLKDQIELIYCVICSGSDYSSGLKGVGPKTVLNLIKDREGMDLRIHREISNFKEIYDTLLAPLPMSFLKKSDPDPISFVSFLRSLHFNEKSVLKFTASLF